MAVELAEPEGVVSSLSLVMAPCLLAGVSVPGGVGGLVGLMAVGASGAEYRPAGRAGSCIVAADGDLH